MRNDPVPQQTAMAWPPQGETSPGEPGRVSPSATGARIWTSSPCHQVGAAGCGGKVKARMKRSIQAASRRQSTIPW